MSKKSIKLAVDLIEEQKLAIQIIKDNVITIVRGKYSTGKSATVFSYVLNELLLDKTKELYITKPPVTAAYDIGYLPGSLEDKTAVYHAIIFSIIKSLFIGEAKDFNAKEKQLEKLMERIHIFDIPFLRGITFPANSIIIAEEMQNLNFKAAELLTSRVGNGAKLILVGDERQIDVKGSAVHRLIEIAKMHPSVGDVFLTVIHRDPVAIEVADLLGMHE